MSISQSVDTSFNAALGVIRQDIQGMHAYAVQDSAGMVKLDAMENPYELSPELQNQLGQRLGGLAINRYPGDILTRLKAALLHHVSAPQGMGIVLGNGSDELISMLAIAIDLPGATIVAPAPGFVMYDMSAKLQGLRFVPVDLTADFELDTAAMLAAVTQHKPALVYLAYPNNPTANLWTDDGMQQVIAAVGQAGGLVVIDEAYQPFAGQSFFDRMGQYPHVLLLRTLSKFGLAGARIGYLLGPKVLTDQIDKVRPPYNISVLNGECALFALEHHEVFEQQATQIVAQRAWLQDQLATLPGVTVFPSQANMVLIRLSDQNAGRPLASPIDPNRADFVFNRMKEQGVLVKNVSKMHSLLHNCLRLTVGTPSENQKMVVALKASL